MADQDWKADFIITPKVVAFRYLDKEPTEEEGIKGDQQNRVGEVPMIFEIKLPVDEAQDKIGVWEKSHGEPGKGPPISNFFITDSLGHHPAGQHMCDRIHK